MSHYTKPEVKRVVSVYTHYHIYEEIQHTELNTMLQCTPSKGLLKKKKRNDTPYGAWMVEMEIGHMSET